MKINEKYINVLLIIVIVYIISVVFIRIARYLLIEEDKIKK